MAAGGYTPGSAYIQVIPSFDHFQQKIRREVGRIRDVHVDVEPDVDPADLQREVDDAVRRMGPVDLDVDADVRPAELKLRELEAKHREQIIQLDIDEARYRQKIERLEAQRGETTIDVDAEISKAEAQLARLAARRGRVEIRADADTLRARQKLDQLQDHAHRVGHTRTDINLEANDVSRAIFLMGALTSAISAAAFAAPAVAAGLAGIGVAATSLGQGIAALAVGFNGVGDAVEAMQAVEDEAVTKAASNAASRVSATNATASAIRALEDAQIQADRAAVDGAERVKQAERGVADAQRESARQIAQARQELADAHRESAEQIERAERAVASAQRDALRRVEAAERNLARAQDDAREAQESLTRAREEAAERLEDLHLSLAGAALDEEAAVLALEEARERLAKARENGLGGRELQEIDLAARQAEQSLAEIRERYGDLQEESTEAARVGVEGSAEVVAANERINDAAVRVADAERQLAQVREDSARDVAQANAELVAARQEGARTVARAEAALAQAQADGARSVARAQEQVISAQRQAAEAQADAARRVADAQARVAQAAVEAGGVGSAAMGKLELAMSKLTPEGRSFARFIQNDLKPALEEIGRRTQSALLPHMETALRNLLVLTPQVSNALEGTADTLGKLAVEGSEMMTSGPWRKDFATIAETNNKILESFGQTGLSLADAFRSITVAAGPLAVDFARAAEAAANTFNEFIQGKRATGELRQWFDDMGLRLQDLWEVIKQVGGAFIDVATALAPLGGVILNIIGPVAELIGNFAEANPTLIQLIATVILLKSAWVSVGRSIGGTYAAVASARAGYARLFDSVNNARTGLHNLSMTTTQYAGTARTLAHPISTVRGEFTRLRTTVDSAADSTQFLGRTAGGVGGKLRQGLGGAVGGVAGILGGPLGIALTAATVGLGLFASAQAKSAQRAAEHEQQIQELTQALREDAGAIGEATRAATVKDLADKKAIENARELGISTDMVTDAALSNEAAMQRTTTAIDAQIASVVRAAGGNNEMATALQNAHHGMLQNGEAAHEFIDIYQGGILTSDRFTEAQKNTLIALLDLKAGTIEQSEVTRDAIQANNENAAAENGVAIATYNHWLELTKLNSEILKSVDADLAYRTAVNQQEQAQYRAAEALRLHGATSQEYQRAAFNEERQILNLLRATEQKALATSNATSADGRAKDAAIAQQQEVARLAEIYGTNLPPVLQDYVNRMRETAGVSNDAKLKINEVGDAVWELPDGRTIPVHADTQQAHDAIEGFIRAYQGRFIELRAGVTPVGSDRGPLRGFGGALGGIIEPMARGGTLTPMAAGYADMVPPNTWRVIGDRMRDDEAYIPINDSRRSRMLLEETARRMGFGLVPMLTGGLLRMANGAMIGRSERTASEVAASVGIATAPQDAGALADAVGLLSGELGDLQVVADLATDSSAGLSTGLTELRGTATELSTTALDGLVAQINTASVPALQKMQAQSGVLGVATRTLTGTIATSSATNTANVMLSHAQITASQDALQRFEQASWAFISETIRRTHAEIAANQIAHNTFQAQSWQYIADVVWASVNNQRNAFWNLEAGLSAVRLAMQHTADWAVFQYDRVYHAAANPIRETLRRPLNQGIIAAWNKLDADFGFNKHVGPVAITFAHGGLHEDHRARIAQQGGPIRMWAEPETGGEAYIPLAGHKRERSTEVLAEVARRFGYTLTPQDFAWFADGGLWRRMFGVVKAQFPTAHLSSAYRAGDPGYHGQGKATDITGPMAEITRWLATNFANSAELIHNPGGSIDSGRPVPPSFWGPATWAGHRDHVHWSLETVADLAGRKGIYLGTAGGGIDFSSIVNDAFAGAYRMADEISRAFPNNLAAFFSTGMARQAADKTKAVALDKLSEMAFSGTGVERWRGLVLRALEMLGLPSHLVNTTLRRMNQESGGNPAAINNYDINAARGTPSKGLMQVIDPTFAAHRDPRAPNNVWDPLANILASMRYALSRYGSLPAAYDRAGGYDDGGWLPPGYSTVVNRTGKPEAVLTHEQWRALRSLAVQNSAAPGGRTVNVYARTDASPNHIAHSVDRHLSLSARL